MSFDDFKVPPLSWPTIGSKADRLRSQLQIYSQPFTPIMEILEKILDRYDIVRLEVRDRKEMGSAEGYACPSGDFIALREDVYAAAWAGEGRARFTAAHELGHWALHTNIPLPRVKKSDGYKPFELAEPQANQFAAEFLMPSQFISGGDSPKDLMERHGVSYDAANNRLSYLSRKGLLK